MYNQTNTSVLFEKEAFPVKKVPQISEAEFEVMKVVWEHAPINTNEVIDRMVKITDWNDGTIRTLLARLVKKGVLSYTKDSRVFVYTPTISESEYLKTQSRSYLDKFYDGDLNSLILSIIDKDNEDDEKLDALFEALKARKEGKKE